MNNELFNHLLSCMVTSLADESQGLLRININGELADAPMGGPSEREYREKLNKILDNTHKGAKDVHEKFANIQKIKVEALKKTEEVKRSADHEIDKTMMEITKSQDLAVESKGRLQAEISDLRSKIEQIYADLKKRISETMVPSQAP